MEIQNGSRNKTIGGVNTNSIIDIWWVITKLLNNNFVMVNN